MVFLVDVQELKSGLIIFRRADVEHKKWYCRVKVPGADKYKSISLQTPDINEARDKAFDHDADIRFRVKHGVPVFDRTFAEVAQEYSDLQKKAVETGQITMQRWKTIDCLIRLHLLPYLGSLQIVQVGEDKWDAYPLWRKESGRKPSGPVKNGSIRHEMVVFRAIMRYAAKKGVIRENQIPKGKLPADKERREAFTPTEYRALHTFARTWIADAEREESIWYRSMTYNFILVMTNTGMRPSEAKNLRWRDIDARKDRQGRPFVVLNVRGKGKFRELVAPQSVAEYLERIRALSKAVAPGDFVFTTQTGERNKSLYDTPLADLLEKSKLLYGPQGSRRSSYCFRHTYATFRLMEGVDVYFLAKQMGTSVKMIEDYYGHITASENAERILDGIPGWNPKGEDEGGTKGGVNAAPARGKAKPRTKKAK